MSNFKQSVAEIERVMEEARAKAAEILKQEFLNLFNVNPTLKVVVWHQYTPYFNDGDECTFSVGDVYASNYEAVNHYGEWDEDLAYDPETDETMNEPEDLQIDGGWGRHKNDTFEGFQELREFMQSSLGEEVLKEIFGDHTQIRATREGFQVDEYEHE